MDLSYLDIRFVALLGLLALLRFAWPKKHYAALGALSSAVLILLAAPGTLIAISGITILFLMPLLSLSRYVRNLRVPSIIKESIIPFGIASLVLVLVLFKVFRQFTIPGLGGRWLHSGVLALIGFSYFIFRAIDYLRTQHILKPQKIGFWELLFYVLFPPTLSSGPIQRFQDFSRQLSNPQELTPALGWDALYRITRGYFRKAVVAALLNRGIESLLDSGAESGPTSVLVLIGMYLFFYFDFAGYSDIAIGFGLLLGIRVPENFKRPFLATSISEFWRNWHITLVDWFRVHVFIPFGGMRGPLIRSASLALLIMVFVGLWHGLTLPMLAWGVWHGLNSFLEALCHIKPITPGFRRGPKYWGRVVWTNARVALGGIFFLPDTQTGLRILSGLVNW